MNRKTKQDESKHGLNKLVTVINASRLAGVDRGIGQHYTQIGIIKPTQAAGVDGGWNRYGIAEIVELAVAKALAEAGVRLGTIIEQFCTIRTGHGWDGEKYADHPELGRQLTSRLFDPFPDIHDWPDLVGETLRVGEVTIQTPPKREDWPEWWRRVKDILPSAWGTLFSRSFLFLPPLDGKWSEDQNFSESYSQLMEYMQKNIRLADMGETTNIVLVDLAKIKARVGQAIIDDGWLEYKNEPQ